MTASPHRIFGATLVTATTCFALWACLGRIDIVVNAQGRLVPQTFVKVSQPSEAGIVSEVLVQDGQAVKRGQPLLKLDPMNAQQDHFALATQKKLLEDTLARITSELNDSAPPNTVSLDAGFEFAMRRAAFESAVAEAAMSVAKAEAELSTAKAELSRLADLEVHATRQEAMNRQLIRQGFVSIAAYDEKQRDARDATNKVASQERTIATLTSALAQATATQTRVKADYRKALVVERAQAATELTKVSAELAKAEHREALATLRAPVAGVVNSLAVKTAGQVVQPGSALLTVVPEGEPLIAEVWVRNEDAGFVSPGMPVKVKLAAFPFQKYGWINGEVQWIGADSETPEAMRNSAGEVLFYRARIALASQALERDGKHFDAKPGMQVIADVQLGERSLLEYLTSPIKKTVLEAAREK